MIKVKTIDFLLFSLIIILLTLTGCQQKRKSYSFFVAGHVYGAPGTDDMRIHPPFRDAFPFIKEQPYMVFGILTGDVVYAPSVETFEMLKSDMSSLELPYYVVPGNHDAEDRELFASYFGDKMSGNNYSSFIYERDLFILLDATINDENISGKQLEFLRTTLNDYAPKSSNIFVFVHQLIWWNKNNEFGRIKMNWPPDVPENNNYWTEVEPLFANTNKPVYIFAGDLGAHSNATPYLFHKQNKIRYIAGGMGNLKNDNFVLVRVNEFSNVTLDLIALQGDVYRLGDLEDYTLPN